MFSLLSATVVSDLSVALAIIAMGSIFFARYSKAGIFYLIAAIIFLFIGFSYASQSIMLLIAMIGAATMLVVFTFMGGDR